MLSTINRDHRNAGTWLARFLTLSLVLLPAFGSYAQTSPATPTPVIAGPSDSLQPGVVIEKIFSESSGAQLAGMQPGDVLLRWSRGNASGKLDSTFDFDFAELSEMNRGLVQFEGLRGTEPRTWTMTKRYFGTQVRPNFSPSGHTLEAVDFQASRATAISPDLANYRIVHLATHGLLNSQHPELSGLVFSLVDKNGNTQDGFLTLQDIYNLNLPADLVVLSACETGLGKEVSGEGLMGLTRGFMHAGATRVVASLWNVSDVATARLMEEFYKAMEKDGLPPAAALRTAQVKMWKQKRWSSPYYWAAFQIQGEWK